MERPKIKIKMLRVKNLQKSFNFNTVLSDLNLKVNKGEIIHISGSNGAGKTTLLKIIAGILSPELGEVSIFKKDLLSRDCQEKKQIIYWGHQPMIYPHLTVYENINFFLKMRSQTIPEDFDLILEKVNMLKLKHSQCQNFSQGTFQRFNLLRFIVSDWSLALMDEPFSALDIEAKELLLQNIRAWKNKGKSMIIVSHNKNTLHNLSTHKYEIKNRGIVQI
tara:strand:+ start:297 stop:956 length:660 start_codon:yes stop_codon:yes gene_type:complete